MELFNTQNPGDGFAGSFFRFHIGLLLVGTARMFLSVGVSGERRVLHQIVLESRGETQHVGVI